MARLEILLWVSFAAAFVSAPLAEAIGVNWGSMMSHQMDPRVVVQMLKANGINKVKLFDAESWTVGALAGTGIEVIVAIPNDQLERMSSNYDNAKDWVKENVTRYDHDGVSLRYVAVGNEPFLQSYNNSFTDLTFPALKNIQKALDEAGVGDRIKATVPLNADVYSSMGENPVPSAGNFRSDIQALMVDIVKFLHSKDAPFVVNIYPFLSLYYNDHFPIDFAFFDGGGQVINDNGKQYDNVFDANFDTLVWALKKAGVPDMKIVVGEVGWPTDGNKNANLAYAKRFYKGFLNKMAHNKGTPLRPGYMEVYLFGLIDEDMKSILPGNFERHWGIFTYDGKPKFPMDLSGKGQDKYLVGAVGIEYLPKQWCVFNTDVKQDNLGSLGPNIQYACSLGDCTSLGYGSSCNNLDVNGNISYAFNMYFQMEDQDVRACNFDGLAKTTTTDPSQNGCLFPVQILSAAGRTSPVMTLILVVMLSMIVGLWIL